MENEDMKESTKALLTALCGVVESVVGSLMIVILLALFCNLVESVVKEWKNHNCYCRYY